MYFKGFSFIVYVCDPHKHTLTPEKGHTHIHPHTHVRRHKTLQNHLFLLCATHTSARVRPPACALVLRLYSASERATCRRPSASHPQKHNPRYFIRIGIRYYTHAHISGTVFCSGAGGRACAAHYNLRYINIYFPRTYAYNFHSFPTEN